MTQSITRPALLVGEPVVVCADEVAVVVGDCFCCTPWVTLPEIVCAMPLFTTIVSVGMTTAPPVLPLRPSSCSVNSASCPAGAGAGCEGAAPAVVTANPGRVTV